jgi:long-chain acyl-CoA synthetase
MTTWGSDVGADANGRPGLVYQHRPHAVSELLDEARRWSDRDHVIHDNVRLTFKDFVSHVEAIASRLRASGVEPGDAVAIAGANSAEWLLAFWAAMVADATVVPCNAWWTKAEFEAALDLVPNLKLAIADERRSELLPDGLSHWPIESLRSLQLPDTSSAFAPPPVTEDQPAIVLFTSGTTAAPKGVILSQRSVIANLQNMLVASRQLPSDSTSSTEQSSTLVSVPLFHIGGIQTIISSFVRGGKVVFLPSRFDAKAVLTAIQEERVTSWGAVPTMMIRLLEHPDFNDFDLSSLKSLTLGAAPVTPELVSRVREAFPDVSRGPSTIYGLTESGGILTTARGTDLTDRPGSSGKALPVVELRISEPDLDGIGEIEARSPTNMSGYLGVGDEEQVVDDQGWLRTGDLGRIDSDGHLYVVDRRKDVIIRGGENVASARVEARLAAHPSVAEVCVVGLANPDLGEEVGAVVVARTGSYLDRNTLATWAAAELAPFEVPTQWWIRTDSLPTNDVGKILKRKMRELWPAPFGNGAR